MFLSVFYILVFSASHRVTYICFLYLSQHTIRSNSIVGDIVKLLNVASKGELSVLKTMFKAQQIMSAADYDKRTALHVAAAEGHLDCVKFLVEICHVPIKPKDRWGFSPLDEAKRFKRENVQLYLEERDTELETQTSKLLNKVKANNVDELRKMFEKGQCDMFVADYDDRTALHVAAAEGHLDCVKFLVEVCQVPSAPKDRWGIHH